jgi:hypothetical protein
MEWPTEVLAIYVICHPVKEKARWDRLLPHLLSRGIPRDRIRVAAPTWGADLTPAQIFAAYDPFLKRAELPAFTFKAAGLSRGEISLGMNFAAVARDVAGRAEEGSILVFESDTWLRADFLSRLWDLLRDLRSKGAWDIVSLGEGVGTRVPGAPSSYYAPTRAWEPPHRWVFRCTDSILFTTGYLRRLAQTLLPFKEIIDWEMNFQLMLHRGKAYWCDPPIAEQGTCFARVPTLLPA